MKKNIIFMLFFIFLYSSCLGDELDNLKKRLNKIHVFHAKFIQKVTDAKGNQIYCGYGDLWVKRPNLFNWHMIQPDEITMISDGKTLWIYNPSIKQVIATYLQDTANNTPLLLFFYNKTSSDWKQYSVKQHGDHFIITPKDENSKLKQFTIKVSSDGTINQFSAIEHDNQIINCQFIIQKNSVIDISKFTFVLPLDVTLDDQRN